MPQSIWPHPGTATCKRHSCEAVVKLKAGHTEGSCSRACRVLHNLATVLLHRKSVPWGRDHESDVRFITRVWPVGNTVPVDLPQKDFHELLRMQSAYLPQALSKPPGGAPSAFAQVRGLDPGTPPLTWANVRRRGLAIFSLYGFQLFGRVAGQRKHPA